MKKYQLYACLGSGNCYKPWLAMQQLGISHQLHLVDVLKAEQKSPLFLSVNPLGVVPYLVTPSGAGIGESGAMLWHLCEDSPLMPTTREKRAQALQWMFFEQLKLEPFISPARFFTTILPEMADTRADDILLCQEQAQSSLSYLDAHLQSNHFMLGQDYSMTDIAVFGYTHVLQEAGLSLKAVPNVARWIDVVMETDGFIPLSQLGSSVLSDVA